MKGYAVQQYPLKAPLPRIARHDQLPINVRELAHCLDTTAEAPGYEYLYTFVKAGKFLSLLVSCTRPLKAGPKYSCHQFDFPLRVLSWFPQALEEFRKPPIAGGLPAGRMISPDQNVAGEMLAVGATTDGYFLVNRSRNSQTAGAGCYDPMYLSFRWEFLFRHGFLDLWKRLGYYYETGQY